MVIDSQLGELDASYSESLVPANISINIGYGIEVGTLKRKALLVSIHRSDELSVGR